MNPELLQTSANLNKSIWYWNPREFFVSENARRIERDNRILSSFFDSEHVLRISNLCFDKCVTDFSSQSTIHSDLPCLTQCKNKLMSMYSDLTFIDIFN